ncbi:MAG TPA: HAD hydrolase family protein, partial [Arenibaculum sp.]|nr:HAD hydrolase family protein [Arenibaculum sp.]
VSDCFKELAAPFLPQLGKPEIRCHRFCANERGDIESCIYAGRTNKADVVTAFHAEGSRTLAIGDAFNDLAMLREATLGILFRPSLETARHAADLPCAETYEEAKGIIGRATESGIFGI